jgi:hypothetical protein
MLCYTVLNDIKGPMEHFNYDKGKARWISGTYGADRKFEFGTTQGSFPTLCCVMPIQMILTGLWSILIREKIDGYPGHMG